eukprot:5148155-Amphidinium_carterae.2
MPKKRHSNAKAAPGKRQRYASPTPLPLLGLRSRTAAGDPICYNFNLNGCSLRTEGNRCDKGVHICMKCLDPSHGAQSCGKK